MLEEFYGGTGRLGRAERLLLVQLCIVVVVASWFFGGATHSARSLLSAIGLLSPLIWLLHYRDQKHRRRSLIFEYALFLTPVVLAWLCYALSLQQPISRQLFINGEHYLSLLDGPIGLPVSLRPELAWQEILLLSSLYLIGLNLFLVTRGTRLLYNFVDCLIISTAMLAGIGLIQLIANADHLFFLLESPAPTFFASFICSDHAALLALLSLAFGLGALLDGYPLLGFLGRPLAYLLLALNFAMVAQADSLLLTLLAALLCGLILMRTLRARSLVRTGLGASLGLGLAALGLALGPLAERSYTIHFPEKNATLLEDRPLFGWGEGSYLTLAAFSSEIDDRDRLYESPGSDWLDARIERGWVGLLGWLAVPALALPMALIRGRAILPALPWLAGAGLLLLLAFSSYPLSTPALALLAWCAWFGGCARLQQGEEAARGARPQRIRGKQEIQASIEEAEATRDEAPVTTGSGRKRSQESGSGNRIVAYKLSRFVRLHFETQEGLHYQLQRSRDNYNWADVDEAIAGTGQKASIDLPREHYKRYSFRLMERLPKQREEEEWKED